MDPVIIEAAINGVTPKARNPHVPISPPEVVDDAIACLDAGAAIIHSHIENYELVGEAAAARYLEAYGPILKARPGAILCSTGVKAKTAEERVAHYAPLAPTKGMAILDPGSVNLGRGDKDGVPEPSEMVYTNTYRDIRVTVEALAKTGLGPSIAIYEPGFLRATLAYQRAGRLPPGALVKLYFGAPRAPFGLPPTRTALDAYLEMLEGSGLAWSVAVVGGDVIAGGLAAYAIEKGGHVRVGLEDFGGPRMPHNLELVQEAVAVVKASGRGVATPAEAARILGLPR